MAAFGSSPCPECGLSVFSEDVDEGDNGDSYTIHATCENHASPVDFSAHYVVTTEGEGVEAVVTTAPPTYS